MSTVLRGYERKEGQFLVEKTGEMREYNNFVLYFTTDDREEVVGLFCSKIKCKVGSFKLIGAEKLEDALHKEVFLMLDPTANPDSPVCQGLYVVPTSGTKS